MSKFGVILAGAAFAVGCLVADMAMAQAPADAKVRHATGSSGKASKPAIGNAKPVAAKPWIPDVWSEGQGQLPPGYAGTDVKKLYELLQSKAALMQRGEFEPSTEYEQRVADKGALLAPLSLDALYAFRMKDFEFWRRLRYDADKQEFHTEQFGYSCLNAEQSDDAPSKYKVCDVDLITEDKEDYVGSNAYGASRSVSRRREHQFGLAIDKTDPLFSSYFQSHNGFQDRLAVPLEKAKGIAGKTLGVLFVGRVLEPSLVTGYTTIITPTIDSPQDIRVRRTAVPFKPTRVVYYVVETGEILGQREL